MDEFNKNYEIIEQITGCISKIKKKNDNNYYILKKIFFQKEEDMVKAENEAQILKNLNHQNIVKYFESFKDNRSFNIIMEYCENLDLKEFIREYKKDNNNFIDQNIIYIIVLDICLGIREIHKNNIIHRDLKPENIFISKDYKIKIGDFGISKKLNNTKHAKTQDIGTSNYMAPDLFKGKKYDNKVDIWALGCIIYELFTLKVCFNSEYYLGLINKILEGNYDKINLEIYSSEWQDLIDSLLQKDPKDRPDIEEVYNIVISLKNKKPKKNNINSLDAISSKILNRDNNNNEEKKDLKKSFRFSRCFKGCPNLEYIDMSIFEPYNISDYSEMFEDCVKLKTIKLTTINNENAKMDNMFKNCHNLQKIYINSSLNINLLKNQLKKEKINPEIIINNHK